MYIPKILEDGGDIYLQDIVTEAGDYSLRTLLESKGFNVTCIELFCFDHGWCSPSLCLACAYFKNDEKFFFTRVLANRYASKADEWFDCFRYSGYHIIVDDAVIRFVERKGVILPPILIMVYWKGSWCKFNGKWGKIRLSYDKSVWKDVEEEKYLSSIDPTAEWGSIFDEIADEMYESEDYDNYWVDKT